MSETKWTPGERWVRPLLDDEYRDVRDWRIAVAVRRQAGPLALVGSEAEGRLFAAAPDLYAALEDAVETIEWIATPAGDCKCSGEFLCVAHKSLADARAALRKARGEEP